LYGDDEGDDDDMKLTNKTVWNTAHLRAILQKAAEIELEPAQRKTLHVTVTYTRGAHSSGCAYIGGRHAWVRIRHPYSTGRRAVPLPLNPAAQAELALHFASVAGHEFAHIRGMHHATMPAKYKWSGNWREYVAWAKDFPLEPQATPVVVKPTATDKLAHVLKMKALAETRVKRATTILKKWKQKERYYQQAAQRAQQAAS
jgi:hypothetical protein